MYGIADLGQESVDEQRPAHAASSQPTASFFYHIVTSLLIVGMNAYMPYNLHDYGK